MTECKDHVGYDCLCCEQAKGAPSDQTDSVNPRALDMQEIIVREMI